MTLITTGVCQNQKSISNTECGIGSTCTERKLLSMLFMLTTTYKMNNVKQAMLLYLNAKYLHANGPNHIMRH